MARPDDGYVDILSEQAIPDLKAANALILEQIKNAKELNGLIGKSNSPSASNNLSAKLAADYTKQQEAIVKLQIQLEKLSQAQSATAI